MRKTVPINDQSLALVEKMTTSEAIAAKNTNEILRLKMPANTPITGGPIKNPIKLMVETAAMAGPGCIVADFPAAL